jgi:hypothetical protein
MDQILPMLRKYNSNESIQSFSVEESAPGEITAIFDKLNAYK